MRRERAEYPKGTSLLTEDSSDLRRRWEGWAGGGTDPLGWAGAAGSSDPGPELLLARRGSRADGRHGREEARALDDTASPQHHVLSAPSPCTPVHTAAHL